MLDSLYENIGGKIKKWAKWIFVFETIGSIITAIALPVSSGDPDDFILISLLIVILGPIVAFVSTWILYAFGQLVEDVHAIRNKDETTIEATTKCETEENIKHKVETICKEEKIKFEHEIKQEWDFLETKQGKQIGRCEICGKKHQHLVFLQFEDQFGKAEKNLCFECFLKKYK